MNKNIRTIIIDDNNAAVNHLVSHFSESEKVKVVGIFNNGEQALEYIVNHRDDFDLILMDILLPMLDGITLLEEVKQRKIDKKVIVLSSYKDDRIVRECNLYNIDYYMIKPISVMALDRRIEDAFSKKTEVVKTPNIDLEVSQLLHNLGIPSHIRGYKYIREGISMIQNNDSVALITKEIYPQIAKKYDTTPSRVERAIRHAIEVSWIRGDLALMEDIFGFSVSCDKAKPTNSEFLSTIADRLKISGSIK